MEEQRILEIMEELGRGLPRFPDGRIDYTHSDLAPVVSVFVTFRGRLLLLKRSGEVTENKGKWSSVSGYLDRMEPIREKVIGELEEETGIGEGFIAEIIIGEPYETFDEETKKKWLICPFRVELNRKPEIRLDFEHTEYRWIRPEEIGDFDTIIDLEKSYSRCR